MSRATRVIESIEIETYESTSELIVKIDVMTELPNWMMPDVYAYPENLNDDYFDFEEYAVHDGRFEVYYFGGLIKL